MSDDQGRIEIITGMERRRRWSATEKLRIVEETLTRGDSVPAVARRHGVAPKGRRQREAQLEVFADEEDSRLSQCIRLLVEDR